VRARNKKLPERSDRSIQSTTIANNMALVASLIAVMKKYGVAFEPKNFEGEDKDIVEYAQGLVSSLIEMTGEATTSGEVIDLAMEYCKCFGIDEHVAPQKQIEYILHSFSKEGVDEEGLRAALEMLPSTAARLSTLRKCIIYLEGTSRYATCYNLHSVALEFYYDHLGELLRECCDEDVIIEPKHGRR